MSTFRFNEIIQGDCLDVVDTLPNASVDAIITDPPYGTTYAPWDCDVPLDRLWRQWARVLKPGGAVLMTASQPFTSQAVASNFPWFRFEWIWDKVNGANFANAKRQPLKVHESVLVFCAKQPVYNPQKVQGAKNHPQGANSKPRQCVTQRISARAEDDLSGLKYPKSIQTFPTHSSQSRLHPTQKPLDLMRYLVRTHTMPDDLVLDCFAGSGTTCLAAALEGRLWLGIEKDPAHVATAQKRLCSLGT